jgi:hypothetical protein
MDNAFGASTSLHGSNVALIVQGGAARFRELFRVRKVEQVSETDAKRVCITVDNVTAVTLACAFCPFPMWLPLSNTCFRIGLGIGGCRSSARRKTIGGR